MVVKKTAAKPKPTQQIAEVPISAPEPVQEQQPVKEKKPRAPRVKKVVEIVQEAAPVEVVTAPVEMAQSVEVVKPKSKGAKNSREEIRLISQYRASIKSKLALFNDVESLKRIDDIFNEAIAEVMKESPNLKIEDDGCQICDPCYCPPGKVCKCPPCPHPQAEVKSE